MKKINWVIEQDLFTEYEDELFMKVIGSGNNAYFLDYSHDDDSNLLKFFNKNFKEDDIVIFHGSLQLGRRIEKLPFYPGIYLTLPNYECYNYYGYFGEHLLNSKYLMMGLNDVLRNKYMIFKSLDVYNNYTNRIFIRPSNGYKSFTGQCLTLSNFDQDFDILTKSYGGLDSNTLVLLSQSQEIKNEYRYVVIDGKIISGALYMDKENKGTFKPHYDKIADNNKALKFAEEMVKLYQPDMAYNIDICELENGEYKLIEINSFCCGSMYGNDYTEVVKAVNDLCMKDYIDVYGLSV